jgi:hypothetical protein
MEAGVSQNVDQPTIGTALANDVITVAPQKDI